MAKAALKAPAPKLPDLVVYECEQSSPEWLAARLGLATASVFSAILASSSDQKGRTTLLRKLAGEIVTGEPMENYVSKDMERGKEFEPQIREWYAQSKFADVRQVGFIYNPAINAGCSPDGLIGDDGMIEIKWASPHVMIEILERGTLPMQHRPQCHGALWVCRRQWIDLTIYSHPKMPKFVARLERNPTYEKEISDAIEVFNYDLKRLVQKLQAMGAA